MNELLVVYRQDISITKTKIRAALVQYNRRNVLMGVPIVRTLISAILFFYKIKEFIETEILIIGVKPFCTNIAKISVAYSMFLVYRISSKVMLFTFGEPILGKQSVILDEKHI